MPQSPTIPDANADAITPDRVISMVIGADSVSLQGFGGAPAPLPFWVPTVEEFDRDDAAEAARKSSRLTRKIWAAAVAVGVVALCVVSILVGQLNWQDSGSVATAVPWAVKSVATNSVLVKIGDSTIVVPVGAMLPNGEILRAVDMRRQNFSTDTQITAVKK